MQNAWRSVEDEALREQLREAKGIGTPATRAEIIAGLKNQGFLKARGKNIVPTDRGLAQFGVLKRANPALVDPGVTAEFECLLVDVLTGRQEMTGAIDAVYDSARRLIGWLGERGADAGAAVLAACRWRCVGRCATCWSTRPPTESGRECGSSGTMPNCISSPRTRARAFRRPTWSGCSSPTGGSRPRAAATPGLGLAIVRGHRGDIALENRAAGGLRATVALPGAGNIRSGRGALAGAGPASRYPRYSSGRGMR